MKTQFDVKELLDKGQIESELEFERAFIAERKLKSLSKQNSKYKSIRKKLRDLIEAYENENWSNSASISSSKIRENDIAELIAEKERQFIAKRKELIKKKLKSYDLTQQQLGEILGHHSKSYMSELINGVRPFSLKDLIIINRIFKIKLSDLIPTVLSHSDRLKIKASISKLNNDKLKFSKEDLECA